MDLPLSNDRLVVTPVDEFPRGLVLAVNRATNRSWRSGVAWTLMDASGSLLNCNGGLFGQHHRALATDVDTCPEARYGYLSYVPRESDHGYEQVVVALRMSGLRKLHVAAVQEDLEASMVLGSHTGLPVDRWLMEDRHEDRRVGIDWVRRRRRPWLHVVCAQALGGGPFAMRELLDTFGIRPYLLLKGLESALFIGQGQLGLELNAPSPRLQEISDYDELTGNLNALQGEHTPVVTLLCGGDWLSRLLQEDRVEEITWFQTLGRRPDGASAREGLSIPEPDSWIIRSSTIFDNVNRLILQRKLSPDHVDRCRPTDR